MKNLLKTKQVFFSPHFSPLPVFSPLNYYAQGEVAHAENGVSIASVVREDVMVPNTTCVRQRLYQVCAFEITQVVCWELLFCVNLAGALNQSIVGRDLRSGPC